MLCWANVHEHQSGARSKVIERRQLMQLSEHPLLDFSRSALSQTAASILFMTTRSLSVQELAKDLKPEDASRNPSTIASLIAGSVGGALQVIV